MKKFFLTFLFMSMACSFLHAIDPHWIPDETAYSGNMSVIGVVQINGVEQSSAMFEIGAFCGDEVRGSQFPQYISQLDRYIFFLTIHGDDPCEITFKLWDHNTGTLANATTTQTMQYLSQSTVGSVSTPYELNFTTSIVTKYTFSGSGSWTLPSNWTGKDGLPLTELPDFKDEDVVINGMAQIQNGTSATVKSLTINSEKVLEINSGASLTVSGEINNNDDANSLVLNDGGQIFQTNEDVNATFRKNIVNPSNWEGKQKDGWQFVSSPIVDAAVKDFIPETGGFDLYIWDNQNIDEDDNEIPWVNYKAHAGEEGDYADFFDGDFYQGGGYLASYQSVTTANFSGSLNGENSFTFEVGYNKYWPWKLFVLGNPFTFDVEWSDFSKTYVTNGYVSLNPKTGSYSYQTEGTIKVGEGFVVQTTKKNPVLEYDANSKSERVKSNNINVIVSNSKGSDNVILCFNGSENGGFPKLDNFNDEIASIFTVNDNVRYGINSYDTDIQEIPLYFDAKEMGTYTISMKPTGDFSYIHLIDRMTGTDTDMLLENEYKFIALSSDNTNRFIVRLSDPNPNHDPNPDCFAYQSGGMLYINELGSIQIIDMAGRVVMNETLNGNSVDISDLQNAAYIVRLVSENGVKTQKIVVL